MKKETRLEVLELAIQTVYNDMSKNLFKALLKRKTNRLLILRSINSELQENNVNFGKAQREWLDEMNYLKSKNCKSKESSKTIDERMLLVARKIIVLEKAKYDNRTVKGTKAYNNLEKSIKLYKSNIKKMICSKKRTNPRFIKSISDIMEDASKYCYFN
jgi:hypothetical protein